MAKVLGLIFNRWVFAAIGLLAIGLLIWFVGPLVTIADYRPLESERSRWILIVVVLVLFLARVIWRLVKARSANAKLTEGLVQQAAFEPPPKDSADAEEVAALRKRFDEAVNVLKQANQKRPGIRSLLPGRQYLYNLPWYVIIGAPGAGKTTLLVNSGLKFPLAEQFGQHKIRGVGGTRNCDWWFTDEAVLLDTAGRYTTQESNAEVDKGAWTGFLQLLKKHRPRRPINGTIAAVSAADLLQQDQAVMEEHAAALRARIQELHEQFGIRFPVYVLITKADLLPGFMEFFGEFGREERAQVWGVSFPLDEKGGNPVGTLGRELDALERRLSQRVVDRLQHERDPQKRSLIYAFPQQFALLNDRLRDFLHLVLEQSEHEVQPMVRGVYFTSGTQEGNPIDRIMGQLARTFHLQQRLLPANKPTGKAYFITRLLKDVMFPEAGLAGANFRLERQRAALEWGALALAGIVTIGCFAAWAISYLRNQTYVAEVGSNVKVVSDQVSALKGRPTADVVGLLPTLQAVRGLAQSTDATAQEAPLSMQFGLYQGDKLASASNAAYRRLLREAFLPRLQARIEDQLRSRGQQNPELLYEALKAYIMLGDPQHLDADALKAFIVADWEASLPRDVTVQQRKDLRFHLDALFAQGSMVSPIVPDAQLIAGARDAIARINLQQRVYNRLKRLDLGRALPEFTIAKAAGPSASLVFARQSGQPLTKGVPGFFSFDGYYKTFVPAAAQATKQMADEEAWVIGAEAKDRPKLTDLTGTSRLNQDVARLYLDEYAATWERFVNDIAIIPMENLQQAIDAAQILSAPDSPLPTLLQAIVKEVTLTKKNEEEKDFVEKAADKVKKTREDVMKSLLEKSGQTVGITPVRPLESIVDDRFDDLRRLVKSPAPGKPAPIDAQIALIGELYTLLSANKAAITGKTALPASDVPLKIKAEAARLPEPVRSVIAKLGKDGATYTLNETGKVIAQAVNTGIGDFCEQAIAGRYPFDKTSTRDVTPDDFARLFAPGGIIEEFFQKNLVQYVDTSARPWKVRQLTDANLSISSATLQQFQRAQRIREVFFPAGGRVPGLKLEFKPVEMDASIMQIIVDVDGQIIKYSHGPQLPVAIQWPGPGGSKQVRLQLSPPRAGGSGQTFEGPWALFRMFDRVKIDSSPQQEKFSATFNVDGRDAKFDIVTNSVQNPFRLPELEQFHCP